MSVLDDRDRGQGGITQLCGEHRPNRAPCAPGTGFCDLGRGGTLGSFCFPSWSGSALPELGDPPPSSQAWFKPQFICYCLSDASRFSSRFPTTSAGPCGEEPSLVPFTEEETEAQKNDRSQAGVPRGQTVEFRALGFPDIWGSLKGADPWAMQERGESDRFPAVPLHPEAWWVPSWLLAPLSGPMAHFGPQRAGGEGGVGELQGLLRLQLPGPPRLSQGWAGARGWQLSQGRPGRRPHSSQVGCVRAWPSQVFCAPPGAPACLSQLSATAL